MTIKNIFVFYKFSLFSDNFSEVETFTWEDHIELDCSFFFIINGGILYLVEVYCFYKILTITTLEGFSDLSHNVAIPHRKGESNI